MNLRTGSRRAGLIALGMAPFVFFLLLLPPDRPASDLDTVPPSTSSTLPDAELGFPFLNAAPAGPTTTLLVDSPGPSPRPSPAVASSPPAATTPTAAPPSPAPRRNPFAAPPAACSNGEDDDGDGAVDGADAGCSSGSDHAESDNPACSDGLDDDGDGAVDGSDAGCSGAGDRDESDDNLPPDNSDGDDGSDDADDGFELPGLPP